MSRKKPKKDKPTKAQYDKHKDKVKALGLSEAEAIACLGSRNAPVTREQMLENLRALIIEKGGQPR